MGFSIAFHLSDVHHGAGVRQHIPGRNVVGEAVRPEIETGRAQASVCKFRGCLRYSVRRREDVECPGNGTSDVWNTAFGRKRGLRRPAKNYAPRPLAIRHNDCSTTSRMPDAAEGVAGAQGVELSWPTCAGSGYAAESSVASLPTMVMSAAPRALAAADGTRPRT
ncbi:hypothetical protein ACFXPA_05320 [Amycolatopsis sp. NPDC059090]|uniref:hypothetical protein n=1 Tax=unclassified Amycolatopsis TaxID=2618356 RepID=UPI003670EF48